VVFDTVYLGLLDGLNICNLSLASLLASLVYSSRISRSRVALIAALFLGSQAVIYYMLGIGLVGSISFLQSITGLPEHFITRIASSLMFVLGGVVVVNALYPGALPVLHPPRRVSEAIANGIYSLGLVGVVLAGSLLAVHSIPCTCTGGVYFTFLSTISSSDYKLLELLVYVMFYIIPSTTILVLALNGHTYRYINKLMASSSNYKVVLGVAMMVVAILLLITT